jgi:hypothetical protein
MKLNLVSLSGISRSSWCIVAILIGTLWPCQAFATEIFTENAFPNEWNYSLRPYFFLSGMSGSVTVDPVTIPLNSKFSDLLKNVKLGGFIGVTAIKGQWGVGGDFQYINLYAKNTGTLETAFDLKNVIGEVDVIYRPRMAPTLRFLAGVRVYSLTQTLVINERKIPPSSTTVIDPVIGAHGTWALGNAWDFELRGDIGGFGISSEFTYQMMALFHWDINDSLSLPFGYRILGHQIKQDSVRMNTRMAGLMLGLDFRF